ncbi:uncharacterized protein LOC131858298 [Cryptomeria japonica]|uniref:uncharacterized protein LOC131858298 n=1 Tax=Cryptomeria japonica TaxID=3369 RepID=UPI0027DA699E|nr:uncharacterized protein LOC131858298 [Cryptomeria japonica]
MESHNNWMSRRVTSLKNDLDFVIINGYGPILNEDKKRVWEEIEHFTGTLNQLCILGGDFNAILHHHEKQGGLGKNSHASLDFADWIHHYGMIEINMVKEAFTWNNRRLGFSNIAEKLVRFFVLGSLINFPFTLDASILPFSGSDHFPIQLGIQAKVSGFGIYKVVNKLKIIKKNLIHWNKEHFGNIFDNKARVEAELVEVNEKVMRRGMDEALFLREKNLLVDHESILVKEEVFWKQKSRETWLEEGDKNTKFFHNSVRMRRVINHISKIKLSGGSEVANPKLIAKEAIDFFSLILNSDRSPHGFVQDKFIKCIPNLLSKDQTDSLTTKFSLAEVEAALV